MNRRATVVILALLVSGLAAVDKFLARVESAEVHNTAEHSYAAGMRLMEGGATGPAIESLREAHSLDRTNSRYTVPLIAALTSAGRAGDAEPLMTDLLQREPNDGQTNLTAARLRVSEGQTAEAEAYFHRAIYGRWPAGADARLVGVRMELIELLARTQRKQQLLAELIALEAEEPADPKIRQRIGALFLRAGSPARAVEVFEALAAKNPGDVIAYEGLGESELEEGRYRAAHDAFERAAQRDPGNESVRTHLDTLSAVTGLDPTLRQLTSTEKYRRSVRILEMARQEWGACAEPAQSNDAVVAAADAAIGRPLPAHATNEGAEEILALAERLWRAVPASCGVRSEVLRLLMQKLAS